jgi:AbrB family looped-hinge helix DNA binding protein
MYYVKEIDNMDTVTVSPKYQVVIPLAIRERSHIRVGERLQVISFDDRIELIPVRPMRSMRGFLKGYDARFERDVEDRA